MNKPMIPNTMARWRLGVLAGALTALLVAGCAVQTTKTQAFSRIDQIETDLRRGITNKADVLLLLGEPDGAGALGGFDALRGPDGAGKGPIDAWFYEFIQIKGDQVGVNILLVFFQGDRYDGYLWFSAKELMTGIPS